MRLQEASAAHDGMLPAHRLTSSRLLTWLAARVSLLPCYPIVQDFTRIEAGHDKEQKPCPVPTSTPEGVLDRFCKSYVALVLSPLSVSMNSNANDVV